jgi:Ribosomal protein L11 methyltransferase (PrmA)/Arginine methyltransferase oligomerization subdomain
MYSISGYQEMVEDTVRMRAYAAALRQAVRPGSIVVDIGAGTGILSLLACRFGAARVYAIEPDDAIHVARENALANGMAEQIEWIQDFSTNVQLREKADVVVSDLRGILPLFGKHIPAIVDARRRFLGDSGRLIPERDVLWTALVELHDQGSGDDASMNGRWDPAQFGLAVDAGRKYIANSTRKVRARPEQLLTAPVSCGTLDYRTIEAAAFSGEVSAPLTRDGDATGVVVWFDAQLLGDIGFSNAPDKPRLIYGSMYFPFSQAVGVSAGDRATLRLQATPTDTDYTWRWDTEIRSGTGSAMPKAELHQSSFFAAPASAARLRKRADSFVPTLNLQGSIDSQILEGLRQGKPLGDIARGIAAAYPRKFATWEEALAHVGSLAERYSD